MSQIWKPLFSPGYISSPAYIISMGFRHLCLLFKGVWECWRQESAETKRKHPEQTQRSCLITDWYLSRIKRDRKWFLRSVESFFLSPSLRGAENGERPAQSIGCGRQSRGTGPRWMSGQHLFHLLAGSYQEKRCHTHWTEEAGEKEAFFSEFKKTCQLLFVL